MSIVYPVYIKIYVHQAALSLNGSKRGDICVCRFDSLWEGDRAYAYLLASYKFGEKVEEKIEKYNKKKIKKE
jgi:hypothetical protein